MRRAYVAALVGLLPIAGWAQGTEPSDCARIEDGNARLLCYDAALRSEPRSKQAPANWTVTEDVSKIDDSRSVFARTQTTNQFRGRFGRQERGFLLARCVENTTSVYIGAGNHFLSDVDGGNRVTYRVDRDSAQTDTMNVSSDNSVLGYFSGTSAIPFLNRISNGQSLVVRLTPYNESPVTLEFDITGIQSALEGIRETCGWRQASVETNSSSPVMVGGSIDEDACSANGVIDGLRADGDGFLSVREGARRSSNEIDRVRNGQQVHVCGSTNGWLAVVYGSEDCGVSSPIAERSAYRGPCRSGWVASSFVTLTAG